MQYLGESLSGVSLASLCPSLWRGTRRVRIVSPRAPFGPLRLQLRLRALTPICRRRRHNGAGAAGGGFLGAQLINLQRPRSLPGPLAGHSHEKEENCSYDYKRPRHRGHGERGCTHSVLFWATDRSNLWLCYWVLRVWAASLRSMILSAIYKGQPSQLSVACSVGSPALQHLVSTEVSMVFTWDNGRLFWQTRAQTWDNASTRHAGMYCVRTQKWIDRCIYIPTSLKQLTGSSLGELHSSVTDVAFGRLFSAMHGKFATPSCMEDKLKVCGTRARVLKLTRQTTRRKWQSRIISTDICSWLIASGTRSAGVHIR
jgi:hypothetical protein